VVREFFVPGVLGRQASDEGARMYLDHWERHGFGRWTVEIPGVTPFAGVVGLMHTPFSAHSPRPLKSGGGSPGITGDGDMRPRRRAPPAPTGSTRWDSPKSWRSRCRVTSDRDR
jgi:hypothetical protein